MTQSTQVTSNLNVLFDIIVSQKNSDDIRVYNGKMNSIVKMPVITDMTKLEAYIKGLVGIEKYNSVISSKHINKSIAIFLMRGIH